MSGASLISRRTVDLMRMYSSACSSWRFDAVADL